MSFKNYYFRPPQETRFLVFEEKPPTHVFLRVLALIQL